MLGWDPIYCAGIPLMNWKLYIQRYFPLVYKMADLNHTAVSRRTAANIIASTINEAAYNDLVVDSILHPFLSLCQDNDLDISKTMLKNCKVLIPRLKNKVVIKQIYIEVNVSIKNS